MSIHYFPAANTPNGFFSRFDNVLPIDSAKKVVYIKGGSGSGKSTLIRKLAKDAKSLGYAIEYCHCSSDSDSLDGINIIDTQTAIFDGTAPHIQDPVYPGAIDKIYNIGEFWDEQLLSTHKELIKKLACSKKDCFNHAYRYFASAKALYTTPKIDYSKILKIVSLFKNEIKQNKDDFGKTRKLFASGLTPTGNLNYLQTILEGKTVGIKGDDHSSKFLKEINILANFNGYDTDTFYCPFSPEDKIEHLVIKGANISFTTINNFHNYDNCNDVIEFPTNTLIDLELITSLIGKGISELQKAKEWHNEIEKLYIKAMNFNKVDESYDKLKDFLFN